MEAKELRIGNLVKYMDEFLAVLAIDSEKELKEYNLSGTVTLPTFWNGRRMSCQGRWMSQVEPIPLTEEWLLKFGFVNVSIDTYEIIIDRPEYDSITFRVMKIDKGFWFILDEQQQNRNGINLGVFYYVHELQNIIFDFTGQELEITKA